MRLPRASSENARRVRYPLRAVAGDTVSRVTPRSALVVPVTDASGRLERV